MSGYVKLTCLTHGHEFFEKSILFSAILLATLQEQVESTYPVLKLTEMSITTTQRDINVLGNLVPPFAFVQSATDAVAVQGMLSLEEFVHMRGMHIKKNSNM